MIDTMRIEKAVSYLKGLKRFNSREMAARADYFLRHNPDYPGSGPCTGGYYGIVAKLTGRWSQGFHFDEIKAIISGLLQS